MFAQVPPVPHKRHPLDAPTDRAGSMSKPAPVPPWPPRGHHCGHHRVSLWPPRGHHSYPLATQPIEDITIASNNGHITIPLNIIELQSMYW